jgi:phosphate transport system protein
MDSNPLLEREIDALKQRLLLLAGKVESNLRASVRAVRDRDLELARKIIDGDAEVDQLEVDLEEECLKILALHQPVALELRFIVAILKINNDLERIGDLAANIAKYARNLAEQPPFTIPFDFYGMAEKAGSMVKTSLDALVQMDRDAAELVIDADDEIDRIHEEMFLRVEEEIRAKPERTGLQLNFIGLSRSLERIADMATNIAEDVIYLIEGEIVRHQKKKNGRS